jgi:hypothetical protein
MSDAAERRKSFAFQIAFAVLAAALFAAVIFTPPTVGVADQNDFSRVMFGIDHPDWDAFYSEQFVRHIIEEYEYTPFPCRSLAPYLDDGKVRVSQIYFVYLGREVSRLLGYDRFQMPIYAILLYLAYVAALTSLYAALLPRGGVARVALGAAMLLIFCDGRWSMWFHSLYGEPVVWIGVLASVSVFLRLARRRGDPEIPDGRLVGPAARRRADRVALVWIFGLCWLFMVGGKLQATELLLSVFVMCAYLAGGQIRARQWKSLAALCVCLLLCLIFSYGIFSTVNDNLGADTTYNSVMTGVVADAADPAAALDELGLERRFEADIGKHAYLDDAEYEAAIPGKLEAFEIFTSLGAGALIRYYARHPGQLWRGLVYSGSMSLTSATAKLYRPGAWLGIHTSAYPLTFDHHRFTLWSDLRQALPKSVYFLLFVLALSVAASAYQWFYGRREYAVAMLALIVGGSFQFLLPYIFNGRCDTAKQLLIFNFIFDLLVFGIAASIASLIAARRNGRRGRRSRRGQRGWRV